jgi:Reverse transcriptase (RNA-dependent DNA polymerase)
MMAQRMNSDEGVNSFGKQLIDLCGDCSLYILNGRTKGDEVGNCTCFPKGGGSSTVDYFLGPSRMPGKFLSLEVLSKSLDSDHCPVKITISATVQYPPNDERKQCHDYGESLKYMPNDTKKKIYQKLFEEDDEVLENVCLAQNPNTDVMNSIQALNKGIFCALNKTYGKRKSGKAISFPENGWYDAECKEMNRCFRIALKGGAKHVSEQLRHEYRRLTRRKKRTFNKYKAAKIADVAKANPRRFWQMYKVKASATPITDLQQWKQSFESLLNVENVGGVSGNGGSNNGGDSGLSAGIQPAEVGAAIKSLKRNKASDLGGMRAEYIIDAMEELQAPIASVFQKVFISGANYPKDWSAGVICPIFKSGDPADCSNYRGITVGNILGKLYASVLERRISIWAETKGIRARGQAGFRKDHRTLDNIFILRTLIDKARSSSVKKKLYVCFVDFKKAFDTVPRELLWTRLSKIGIQGTMLQAIKSMYNDVTACVKTPSGMTDFFPSTMGVKQGCPLSPSLFGFYIDGLENVLVNDKLVDPPLLGDQPVPILLYADDIALISSSRKGLQHSLTALGTFCDEKKLTVNLKKTQIVVFNDPRSSKAISANESYVYKGETLDIVDTYTYLGVVFERGSKWALTKKRNITAMRKAMFAMMHRIQELKIESPLLQCSLFDALVAPVISYGCEMWAIDFFRDSKYFEEAEMMHRAFLRRIVHVRKCVSNEVLLAEFGRLPLKFQWQNLIVRYFNRLVAMPETRLLKQAFLENLELDNRNVPCWSRSIRIWATPRIGVSAMTGDYLKISNPACDPIVCDLESPPPRGWPHELNEIDLWCVDHRNYLRWFHSDQTKVAAYVELYKCTPKGFYDNGTAPYMNEIVSNSIRTILARFRTRSHNLEIETGIWARTPVENRTCKCCNLNSVEDEMHFVFDCPLYSQIRQVFHKDIFEDNNRNMHSLFTKGKVNATGQFLRQCFSLRDFRLGNPVG